MSQYRFDLLRRPFSSFMDRHGPSNVRFEVPCTNKGAFVLRKKMPGVSLAGRRLEKLGFQKPLALTHDIESFGLKLSDLDNIRQDAELCEKLTLVVVKWGFSVRSSERGLAITGNLLGVTDHRPGTEYDTLCDVARLLDAREQLGIVADADYETTLKRLGRPATTVALVAAGYLWLNNIIFLDVFSLFRPALELGAAAGILLEGVPVLLLRKMPLIRPVLRDMGLFPILAASIMTGAGLALGGDVLATGPQQTFHYPGYLVAQQSRFSFVYHLRAKKGTTHTAFGENADDLDFSYGEYRKLKGPNGELTGNFEVSVGKGLLGVPYVTNIKRIPESR